MRTILFTVAAFAAIAPAAAIAAPAAHSFQVDGQTYSYSAERLKDGTVVLDGTAQDGGDFRLNVVKNHVEGQVGVTAVDFYISNDTMAKLAAEVSQDAPTAIASN